MGRRKRGGGGRARTRAATPTPTAAPEWQQRTPEAPKFADTVGREEENDAAAATKESEQKEAEEARDAAPEVGTFPANAEPSARIEQSRSR